MNLAQAERVAEVLDQFRALEDKDSNALLWFQTHPDAAELVLVWPKVPVEAVGCGGAPPASAHERWAWLWRNYRYSQRAWCDLAGIADLRYGYRLCARVISLRLVFPDGNLAGWIERYLYLSAVHESQKKAPPRPVPPVPPPMKKKAAPPSDDDDDDASETLLPPELEDEE